MKKMLFTAFVCAVMATALTGCPGVACLGIDTCQLQGIWEKTVTVGSTTTIVNKIVIKDDTFDFSTPLGGFRGTFKINTFANPKQIDVMVSETYIGPLHLDVNPPEPRYGIYEVSKDLLKVQIDDGTSRPVAFDEDVAVSLAHISAE